MANRLDKVEHDGDEILALPVQSTPIVEVDPYEGLSDDEKRRRQIQDRPTQARLDFLAQHRRPINEPWCSPNNPAIWEGDIDDD